MKKITAPKETVAYSFSSSLGKGMIIKSGSKTTVLREGKKSMSFGGDDRKRDEQGRFA